MASKPGPAAARASEFCAALDCELSSCLTTCVRNPTDEGQLTGWNRLHLATVHRCHEELPGLRRDLVGVDRQPLGPARVRRQGRKRRRWRGPQAQPRTRAPQRPLTGGAPAEARQAGTAGAQALQLKIRTSRTSRTAVTEVGIAASRNTPGLSHFLHLFRQ